MKNLFQTKLSTVAILATLLFGCAAPTQNIQSRTPVVVAAPPVVSVAPAIRQDSVLDKNEVIIDKPAPVQTETVKQLARISPAQSARIAQALKVSVLDAKTLATITPKLRAFIERLSCIRQYNDGGSVVLQALAAPGVSFKYFVPPMHGTKQHNKASCLSVTGVALKPAATAAGDAVQIKVSYVAEDSGETTTSNHEINKNNKGVWWFTR